MLIKLLVIFVLAIVCEAFYTSYAYFVARGNLWYSTLSSGAIAVLKAVLVVHYVREPIMIIMMAVGQMVGTYLMLYIIKKGSCRDGKCQEQR